MNGLYVVNKHPNTKVGDGMNVTKFNKNWYKCECGRSYFTEIAKHELIKDFKRVMEIVRLARKEPNLISMTIYEYDYKYKIEIVRKIQDSLFQDNKEK